MDGLLELVVTNIPNFIGFAVLVWVQRENNIRAEQRYEKLINVLIERGTITPQDLR